MVSSWILGRFTVGSACEPVQELTLEAALTQVADRHDGGDLCGGACEPRQSSLTLMAGVGPRGASE